VRVGVFFFGEKLSRAKFVVKFFFALLCNDLYLPEKKEAYVGMGKQRVVVGEEDGNKMTGDHHWGRVVVPHVFRLVSLYLGQRDVCALLCVSASCHRQLAAHAPVCKVCLLA
jgi:hypothetical protein